MGTAVAYLQIQGVPVGSWVQLSHISKYKVSLPLVSNIVPRAPPNHNSVASPPPIISPSIGNHPTPHLPLRHLWQSHARHHGSSPYDSFFPRVTFESSRIS